MHVMFANFLQLISGRRSTHEYRNAFVEEVAIRRSRESRSPRSERLLVVGWILIGLKCWVVSALISAHQVPINSWWINGPTLASAAVCTLVYIRRP